MSVPDQETAFFYTANGVTTTFAYGFYLLSDGDLDVYLNGVLQTSGYTVTGIGVQSGGTVVFSLPPANGVKVQLERHVDVKRDTNYVQNGDLRADVLNDDFDRIWMVLQEKRRDTVSSIRYPTAENLDGLLPSAATRALNVLGFDETGLHTLLPMPAEFGAGDMRYEVFVSGSDFTPGVTTSLVLERDPGSPANVEVFFDALFQGTDQWGVIGTTLTFLSPIPVGVTKVFVRTGTSLSVYTPPARSVGDAELSWGPVLNRVVSSIADLRNLSKIYYARAFVTGYYASGDGGGGAYYLDAGDVSSADNGGTIIVAADGGRWKMADTNYLTPDHFGAQSGGVTDCLTKFNALVAYLISIGGGTVLVPAKTYFLSDELVITNANVEIRGTNRHLSRLVFGASAVNGLRFSLPSTGGGADYHSVNVYNLTLLTRNDSTVGAAPGKCAIKYVPSAGQQGSPYPTVNINGVEIRGENAFSQFWQTGMHLENAVNAMVNDVVVSGHFNFQDMYYGLITDKFAVNVQVTNCVFNYMATGIIMISLESVAPPGFVLGCEGLQVIGCQFGGVQRGVVKDNGTSVEPRPLTLVTGCHINATLHCVHVSNCTETVITGNLFYLQDTVNYTVAAGSACIKLDNPNSTVVNRHSISGNLIRSLAAEAQVRGIVSDVGFLTIGECVFDTFDFAIILSNDSNTNSVVNCGFINISVNQIQNAGAANWYSAKTPMALASSFDIF